MDLDPIRGREQAGRRPVLVVSSDAINRQPLVVTIVVGTAGENISRDYPTNIRMSAAQTGLPAETVFLCFQLRSLDPRRFTDSRGGEPRPAGMAPPDCMRQVEAALRLVLEN